MVAANIFEEAGVVAEVVGMVGVGVNGAFVEVFGSVMFAAKIGKKVSIVTEMAGMVGVGVDGTFVEGLGGIVVVANIGEEDGVVFEVPGVTGVGLDGAFVEVFEQYPAALAALSELRLVSGRNTNRIEHDLQIPFILLFRQTAHLIPT